MNKAQVNFEKCKRIARENIRCLSILLKVLDKNREDVLDQINEVNRANYQNITPEGIVALYDKCDEDIDKFIAIYDKAMDSANYIHKNFYDDYQEGMKDFCKD